MKDAAMPKLLFLLLLVLVLPVTAQKNDGLVEDYKGFCHTTYPKTKLEGPISEIAAAAFLRSYCINLRGEGVTLQLKNKTESPGGFHFCFVQLFNGLVIYQSDIKVNINRAGEVTSVLDNSFTTTGWSSSLKAENDKQVIAVDIESQQPYLATLAIENNLEVIHRNGEVVFSRDMRSYFAQDSVVTGQVFNPDPLTTAHQVYTGTDLDLNDANSAWLTAQLQQVNFTATFTGSQFQLLNQYITLKDIDSPQVPVAFSTDGNFNYNRSQTGFEDVNAFYHLNKVREHVHALGFNIADQLIWVDTHSGTADQSYFSPLGLPGSLNYGTGGVDDAEDADVLTHEYGHFLSYNASPGSNVGSERNSMDEGFGDYVAASYSKALDTYKSEWVFNWDGHNNYWNGRVVNSSKVYPTNIIPNSIYKNAEIWSALLMSIHDDIGRVATDSLIFEAHYGYNANMSMTDGGYLLLQADSDLTNGHYHCQLLEHLFARGILAYDPGNQCGISGLHQQALPTAGFLNNPAWFGVTNSGAEPFVITLFDIAGNQLTRMEESQAVYTYNNASLPAGLYLVHVQGTTGSQTFKWCKAQ